MVNANRIAVFVDAENVGGWIKQGGVDVLIHELKTLGHIIIRHAYGVWSRPQLAMHQATLNKQGFELIHCYHPASGKNSADIHMTVDVMECAWQYSNINYFVLVTGDSDFSPVFRRLRAIGKEVIGVGQSSTLSQCIEGTCSKFIYTDGYIDAQNKAIDLQQDNEAKQNEDDQSQTSNENNDELLTAKVNYCLADQYRKLLNKNNFRPISSETIRLVYKFSQFQNENFATLSGLKEAIFNRLERQKYSVSKTDINKAFFLFIRANLISTLKDDSGLSFVNVKKLDKKDFLLKIDNVIVSRLISLARMQNIELKPKEIKKLTISSISKDEIKELLLKN